jgi:hypothetical protein
MVPYPHYPLDLGPRNFLLFPVMKLEIREKRFNSVLNIYQNSQQLLNFVMKEDLESFFQ